MRLSANPRLLLTVLAAAVLVGLLGWGAVRIATGRAVQLERARLDGVAALAAGNYRRQVEKFQLAATTLSADPEVGAVLERRDAAAALRLNARLARLSATLDASVIYLMDLSGETVVASNWRQPDSFVGENYRFRAYYQRAIVAGEAQQYALGTRSRVPGLFMARRIDGPGGALGVIVVKIRFDRLEREWRRTIGEAFVANRDGILLVTSDPQLRFRTLADQPPERRAALRQGQEFGQAPLDQHPAFAAGSVLGTGPWRGERLLAASVAVGDGRTLTVLAPIDAAVRTARNVALLAVALLLSLGSAAALIVAARRRVVLARAEAAHRRRLDDLTARLEQANRLSFLGQIAAGVGHEVNQPLAAIALRAGSARRLIATQRRAEADAALAEIEALVGRAGAITGELRTFARRGERTVGAVRLQAALDGLAMLLSDRVRRMMADIAVALDQPHVAVLADQGRLEQVLVNLVQNALDAGGSGTRIAIASTTDAATVALTIADDGPGIPPELRAALFQPFTTSKPDGLGLGLVISRDIVAEFGGELTLEDSAEGTIFRVLLRRAP